MAAVLWQMKRRGMFVGQLFKLYMICYFVYRFLTEFIRPEQPLWLGLTGYQWAALWLIPVFAGMWWWSVRETTRPAPLTKEAS